MPRRSSRVFPIGDGTESLMPAGSTSSTYWIGSHSSGVSNGTTTRRARSGKAAFDEAFFHRHGRAFAASWDGTGLPEDVVDVAALRREWGSGAPAPQSLSLLQVAWLARESAGRVRPLVV